MTVLAPTKESADLVLLLRDLARLFGNEKAVQKSAGELVSAAERVEEAFESVEAMRNAKRMQAEAETALAGARVEADAIVAAAQEEAEMRRKGAETTEAQSKERASALDRQQTAADNRDAELSQREAALTNRAAALSEAEGNLADELKRLSEARDAAAEAQKQANAREAEFDAKMERLRELA